MQTTNNHKNNITRIGRAFSGIVVPHFTRPVPGFNLFYSQRRPDIIKDQRNAGHIDRGHSHTATKSGNESPSYPESQRQIRLTSDGISGEVLKQATSSTSA